MTLGELKREIFSLNFEDFSEYGNYIEQVIYGINRSISIIMTELCPAICYHEISQQPLENVVKQKKRYGESSLYDTESELWFESGAEAVSYYFECDGEGEAVIYDKGKQVLIPLVGGRKFTAYKGFCDGGTAIKFRGDFAYSVKNVAFYEKKLSARLEDIPPYKQYFAYDMRALTNGDFMGLEEVVLEGERGYEKFADFKLEGYARLLLPAKLKGQFRVGYKKGITPINSKTPDSYELELSSDVAAILPLLCAYFVWMDDERSRSQEYYAQYEMRRDMLLRGRKKFKAAVVSVGKGNKLLGGGGVWQ